MLADGNRQSFDSETDERDNVFGTFVLRTYGISQMEWIRPGSTLLRVRRDLTFNRAKRGGTKQLGPRAGRVCSSRQNLGPNPRL